VDLEETPCPGSNSQQHRLPLGFKPLTALENLDRTAVLTARDQVLSASLEYYWEGAPQDVVGQALRRGIECQSAAVTPVDYQPRVEHDAVLTGQVTAFNVEETEGGRFVVSVHLDLWSRNLGARIATGEFNAYAPLENFNGDTIAKAASNALGRVVPKVVDWLDAGLPKIQKAVSRQ
jgi:cholesterol transport system auxiliary component